MLRPRSLFLSFAFFPVFRLAFSKMPILQIFKSLVSIRLQPVLVQGVLASRWWRLVNPSSRPQTLSQTPALSALGIEQGRRIMPACSLPPCWTFRCCTVAALNPKSIASNAALGSAIQVILLSLLLRFFGLSCRRCFCILFILFCFDFIFNMCFCSLFFHIIWIIWFCALFND